MERLNSLKVHACALCRSKFDTSHRIPRILHQCKHNVCQVCLKKLLSESPGDPFLCPVCQRRNSPDPDNGLNEEYFPRNASIITELVRTTRSFSLEKCEKHGSPVNQVCMSPACENKRVMCKDCAKLHHRKCDPHYQVTTQNFNKNVRCENADLDLVELFDDINKSIDEHVAKLAKQLKNYAAAVNQMIKTDTHIIAELTPATLKTHYKKLNCNYDEKEGLIVVQLKNKAELIRLAEHLEKEFLESGLNIWEHMEDLVNKSMFQIFCQNYGLFQDANLPEFANFINRSLETFQTSEKLTHLGVEPDSHLEVLYSKATKKVHGMTSLQRSSLFRRDDQSLNASMSLSKNASMLRKDDLTNSMIVPKTADLVQMKMRERLGRPREAETSGIDNGGQGDSSVVIKNGVEQSRIAIDMKLLDSKPRALNLVKIGSLINNTHVDSHSHIIPIEPTMNDSVSKVLNITKGSSFARVAELDSWALAADVSVKFGDGWVSLSRDRQAATFDPTKVSFAWFRLPKDTKLKFKVSMSTFFEDFENLNDNVQIEKLLEESAGHLPFFLLNDSERPERCNLSIGQATRLSRLKAELGVMMRRERVIPKRSQTLPLPTSFCSPVIDYCFEYQPGKRLVVSAPKDFYTFTGLKLASNEEYTLCIKLPFPTSHCRISPLADELEN